jgi:AraC family transcriptional regulator
MSSESRNGACRPWRAPAKAPVDLLAGRMGLICGRDGRPRPAAGERAPEVIDPDAMMKVEAELRVPIGTVQLMRFNLPAGLDNGFVDDARDWIDLCLTPRPRNTRARFCDRWGPNRFEKVGQVFLIPRGETMQFKTDGGAQTSVVCHLEPEPLREWLPKGAAWAERRIEAGLNVGNDTIRMLMRRLADELRTPRFASHAMAELIAGQIAIEIARFTCHAEDASSSGGLAAWRLRRIDERLTEVREPPTLTELAEACNMSVRQLTRSFRASRDCSIGDYINQTRIETAKRLLMGGESVKAIAISMGFSSASHFTQAFRRATGFTPRSFRATRAGALS